MLFFSMPEHTTTTTTHADPTMDILTEAASLTGATTATEAAAIADALRNVDPPHKMPPTPPASSPESSPARPTHRLRPTDLDIFLGAENCLIAAESLADPPDVMLPAGAFLGFELSSDDDDSRRTEDLAATVDRLQGTLDNLITTLKPTTDRKSVV